MDAGYLNGTPLGTHSPGGVGWPESGAQRAPAGAGAREAHPTPAVGEGLADAPGDTGADEVQVNASPQVSTHAGAWEKLKASPLADNPLLLLVAGIGFSVSFQTISHEAAAHGLPGWSPLYPIGVDIGILALILEARKLARLKRSDLVPRILAWALAIGTIYVNMHGSPPHDWIGRTLHAIMPALWIVFLELTRWRQRADIKKIERADPIPLARWLLLPYRTAKLKKRMIETNTLSYRLASALEDARVHMRDLSRAHYGGRWGYWRNAPSLLRINIRRGRLGDDVTEAVADAAAHGHTGGWEMAVIKAVTEAVTRGDKLAVAVRQERRQASTPRHATAPRQNGAHGTPRSGGSKSDRMRAKVAAVRDANPGRTVKDLAGIAGMPLRTFQRHSSPNGDGPQLSVVEEGNA